MPENAFSLNSARLSLKHDLLLKTLSEREKFLLIQDLDGVCMQLVRDPLTRKLSPTYIRAAKQLAKRFFVLTNGEHIGKRGVNQLVDQALESNTLAKEQGLYLPGLGGGGVQWQDSHGNVATPGVSAAETEFLESVPARFKIRLLNVLSTDPFLLSWDIIEKLSAVIILDNPVSPTININDFSNIVGADWQLFLKLQIAAKKILEEVLVEANAAGLSNSFFIHYAPNLGIDDTGEERLKWSNEDDLGTTDFQFMLKGAIKEVGVLLILNRYFYSVTGDYPLGEDFNARQAPRDHKSLIELAHQHFDPALMPCLVGVGDTITSQRDPDNTGYLRGGSDRGFLSLIQGIGNKLGVDNSVIFVDSSAGELNRPSVDASGLVDEEQDPWCAMSGITDADDPLKVNFVFPGGHSQYIDFFCRLASDC